MSEITLRTYTAQDADWVIQQHAVHYAAAEGFDASFGALVTRIVTDFDETQDPARERRLIAWRGDQRLGSVFCVRVDDDTARLRLFLLDPTARGLGLGHRLLNACQDIARQTGYCRMVLSTHESHRAACALYAQNGWHITARRPVQHFGADLIELDWETTL